MHNKFKSISALWGQNNRISAEEGAKQIYQFLLLLKSHNEDLFANWYEGGYSKREAMEKKIDLTQEYIRKAVEKNWNRKFDDLGSRISYWTGHEDDDLSGSISFSVGGYGNKPFNRSSCVISLPIQSPYYEIKENQRALIKLLIDFWKPDTALINGEEVLRKNGEEYIIT
jgi:hypothetical protein